MKVKVDVTDPNDVVCTICITATLRELKLIRRDLGGTEYSSYSDNLVTIMGDLIRKLGQNFETDETNETNEK